MKDNKLNVEIKTAVASTPVVIRTTKRNLEAAINGIHKPSAKGLTRSSFVINDDNGLPHYFSACTIYSIRPTKA